MPVDEEDVFLASLYMDEAASRIQALEAELARKTEALERQYPIIQSLGNLLDEYGRTQRDLSKLIGLRARASELVRGKRTLSKDMMELINNEWQIPIEELFATTRFVECRARSALEEKTDV
jgi:antitoxin component HigA of HigAB toxin-antitoxin module